MDGRRPDSGPPPEVATVVVVDRVVIKWRQFELPKSSVRKQKKKGNAPRKKKGEDRWKEGKERNRRPLRPRATGLLPFGNGSA